MVDDLTVGAAPPCGAPPDLGVGGESLDERGHVFRHCQPMPMAGDDIHIEPSGPVLERARQHVQHPVRLDVVDDTVDVEVNQR